MVVDKNDNVWIVNNNPSPDGDSKRCYLGYNEQSGYLGYYKMPFETNISLEKEDSEGNIWSRTNVNALFKFNISSRTFERKNYPNSASVSSFDFDADGKIIMSLYSSATDNVVKYDPSAGTIQNLSFGFYVDEIETAEDGSLWVVSRTSRLLKVYSGSSLIQTVSTDGSPYYVTDGRKYIYLNTASSGYKLYRFSRDASAPVTSASVAGTAGDNGWYVSDVEITLSASDDNSGVDKTYYSFNGIDWTVYTASVVLTAEEESNFYYYSVDKNGNKEENKTFAVKIDKTAPQITGGATVPANPAGWWNSDITIHFEGEDSGSGISSVTADQIVSLEGSDQSVTGTAVDFAGNSASLTVEDLNLDKTAPVITVNAPAADAAYGIGETVLADWTADDGLSGLENSSGTVSSGSAIDTSFPGDKNFNVSASDLAGNESSVSFSYSVEYAFTGFLAPLGKKKTEFKSGSVIPLKFKLADYSGNAYSEALAELYLKDSNGIVLMAVPAGKSNDGNFFRYSFEDEIYIYNLDTNGMSKGAWTISVRLDDGTVHETEISIK